MSDFPLTLVLRLKTSKIIDDMAKVIIKSERITPFGGIFPSKMALESNQTRESR